MRLLPNMEAIWRSGDFVGSQRPIARVTVVHPNMQLYTFGLSSIIGPMTTQSASTATTADTTTTGAGTASGAATDKVISPARRATAGDDTSTSTVVGVGSRNATIPDTVTPVAQDTVSVARGTRSNNGGDKKVTDIYAAYLFPQDRPLEIPTVRSVEWSRSTDQDVASCTVQLYNIAPRPIGTLVPDLSAATAGTGAQQQIADLIAERDALIAAGQNLDVNSAAYATNQAKLQALETQLEQISDTITNGGTLTSDASTYTNLGNHDLDYLGYYSPGRGTSTDAGKWGQATNAWRNMLMPDNMIKTYEGYGADWTKDPEDDPNLTQTGTWLIDDVRIDAFGNITLTCRDVGRILLQQGIDTPVLPVDFAPLEFQQWTKDELTKTIKNTVQVTKDVTYTWADTTTARDYGEIPLTVATTSVQPWSDHWRDYYGHHPEAALDDDPASWYVSVANSSPRARYGYEYMEFTVPNTTVTEVRFHPYKAGYTAYVSLMVNGQWIGGNKIDYHEDGVGKNGSNIAFVASAPVTAEDLRVIKFAPVDNVQRMRLTFGNLQYFPELPAVAGTGNKGRYRAGWRLIEAWVDQTHTNSILRTGTKTVTETETSYLTVIRDPGPPGANPGRYTDYTDIVKLLLAWGGWYWPQDATTQKLDGSTKKTSFDKPDTAELGDVPGRIWGDFMTTGQSGPNPISSDKWMDVSLMDAIGVIRETVGFLFYIDEFGAAQWRYPNIDNIGNWIHDDTGLVGRTPYVRVIDEAQTLQSLEVTMSSQRLAEIIIITDDVRNYTAVTPGYNPNPTGLRRVVKWTDAQYLASTQEADTMGELIATRMLFNYRSNNITVAGFPGLQIDDQIKLSERVTGDSFYHLITGISSSLDLDSGNYTYQLQTMWLGDTPEGRWVVPKGTRNTAANPSVDPVYTLLPRGGVDPITVSSDDYQVTPAVTKTKLGATS